MNEKSAFKLPLGLVVLDGLGTILVGLGLAKMFAGLEILPTALQLDEKGWTLIISGVLLMLPLLLHIFAKVRERAEEKLLK